jgi:hypothetical protein
MGRNVTKIAQNRPKQPKTPEFGVLQSRIKLLL